MKNNKAGIILVEAIVSMWIFLFLLWGLTYIYHTVNKFDWKINEMLAYSTYTRIVNSLDFVKKRSLSIWAEEAATWSNQNIRYPGWMRLKITSWWTQTLNELSWSYELTDTACPTWLVRCLKPLAVWEFSEIPLSSDFTLYEEDWTGVKVVKTTEKQLVWELSWVCTTEYSNDCLWYKLEFEDMVVGRNPNLQFINSSWVTETIKVKAVKVTIKNGKEEKTYDYILSVF